MAVTLLAHGADTTGGTSQATASISPTANSLLIAIASGGQGTTVAAYGISTALSDVTFNSYVTSGRGDAAASDITWKTDLRRAKLWYASSGATPGSGTITFSCGTSQSGWQWRVWEITDPLALTNNGLDAILQVITAESDADVNTLSANFAALGDDSASLLYVVVDDEADAVVTASGFTMDTASTHTVPSVTVRGGIENPSATVTVAPTWDAGDADSGAFIAVEIARVVVPSEPEITSIDPAEGSEAGGTAVTITGTGFEDGAAVTIGGEAATDIVVVDDTEITAVTPAGTVGTADVVVTNEDTGTDTLTDGFEYTEEPAAAGGRKHVMGRRHRMISPTSPAKMVT